MTPAFDRDPAFWQAVYDHPEVRPHVSLGAEVDIQAIVADARVSPYRFAHGGYLFVQLDGQGMVVELHSLFTPEGWGRETTLALRQALTRAFAAGAQIITTFEVHGNWRSRAPLSFGFTPAGDFAPSHINAELRAWVLTRSAWERSPVFRRSNPCL